jgi:hypothetical protein
MVYLPTLLAYLHSPLSPCPRPPSSSPRLCPQVTPRLGRAGAAFWAHDWVEHAVWHVRYSSIIHPSIHPYIQLTRREPNLHQCGMQREATGYFRASDSKTVQPDSGMNATATSLPGEGGGELQVTLHRPASHYIALHRPASPCIALHRPASPCIALHRPASTHPFHTYIHTYS